MIDKNVFIGGIVVLMLSMYVGWKYGSGKGLALFFGIFIAYSIVLTANKSQKH